MGNGQLRRKLNNCDLDPEKKEQVLKELEYFNSIAPRSLRERLHINKEKMQEFTEEHKVGVAIGLVLLIPLIIMLMAVALQFAVIFVVFWALFRTKRGTPEYQAYDFKNKVALPTVRLFDDKLDLNYHYNRSELIDEDMHYGQALVEEHLVRPMNKRYRDVTYSACSYDWGNTENTDAFEFMGYKLYHEWEDSDGDKHEDIYFDGVILKFRTSFTIDGTINIMSTTTKKKLIGVEKEKNRFKKIKDKDIAVIDTENSEFAENFDTIATYDTEAYRYLTPSMIEELLKLRKDYDICLCIKGNVMTVTLNNKGYKGAEKSAFSVTKPHSRSLDSEGEFTNMLSKYRNAMISIYELKDILDPQGKC